MLQARLEATAEWQPNGALHVLQKVPAIRMVKSTGRPSFFNGLAGVYGNAKDNGALEPPYRNSNGVGYKLPSSYGDGSPIPNHYLDRLIEIQDEIAFLVPWQKGDVALVNNYTVQVCNAFLPSSFWLTMTEAFSNDVDRGEIYPR